VRSGRSGAVSSSWFGTYLDWVRSVVTSYEGSGSPKKTWMTEFGWETVDMGKIEAARAIEPLCMLWCIPGFLRNDWVHAFKLLA